jgi:hypothetical protein
MLLICGGVPESAILKKFEIAKGMRNTKKIVKELQEFVNLAVKNKSEID